MATHNDQASLRPRQGSTATYPAIADAREQRSPPIEPQLERDREGIHANLRAFLNEARRGLHRWPIYLHGKPGCGKTRALLVVCDYSADPLIYLPLRRLRQHYLDAKCHRLLMAGSNEPVGLRSLWDRIARANLVVIDEIGARQDPRGLEDENLLEILTIRAGKPLFLAGNPNIEQLSSVHDDRVVSRISAGTIVHVPGEDRRPGQGVLIDLNDPLPTPRGGGRSSSLPKRNRKTTPNAKGQGLAT